jgi:hypothetical protein
MEIQFVLGIRLLPLVWLACYIGLSTKHGQHIGLLSFRLNHLRCSQQARFRDHVWTPERLLQPDLFNLSVMFCCAFGGTMTCHLRWNVFWGHGFLNFLTVSISLFFGWLPHWALYPNHLLPYGWKGWVDNLCRSIDRNSSSVTVRWTGSSYSHPRCLNTLLSLSASYGLTVVLAFTDDLSTWSLTVSRR